MAAREVSPQVQQTRDIINHLAIVIRTAQVYELHNSAVQNALARLVELVNAFIFIHDVLAVDLFGDYFFVNDTRVRYAVQHLMNFDFLVGEFRNHNLGNVTVEKPVTTEDMFTFLQAFILSSASKEPYRALSEGISSVDSLRVSPVRAARSDAEDDLDIRKQVKRTYFNAVSYVKGIINQIKAGEKIGMKKAKRIIESMVDRLLEEEELLLGMTAIKEYDEYTYHHSVNVSILSVALGQRMGLSKGDLRELGLVALFHDIGKVEVPNEILNKPSELSEDEWAVMRRHPYWGLSAILKLKRLDQASIRAAVTAFEHHVTYGLAGYPAVSPGHDLDLYSRIVMIADRYDAMTSARVYSRTAMAPDRALQVIIRDAGRHVDPLLTKFFVRMIGMYPYGTLVQLDNGELGLVCGTPGAATERPSVLLVADAAGNRLEGRRIELTEKDGEGRFLRTIVRTADPNACGVSLADYLL